MDNQDQDLRQALERVPVPTFQYAPPPAEIAFARHFAITGDLYVSYTESGLPRRPTDTKSAIMARATKLLGRESTQERYAYFRQLVNARLDVREDRILGEIAAVGFSDPADFYNKDGTLKPIHEIPQHARAAIKEYSPINGIKLIDKMGALKTLVAVKNMDAENKEAQAPKIVIGAGMKELASPAPAPAVIDVEATVVPDEDFLS